MQKKISEKKEGEIIQDEWKLSFEDWRQKQIANKAIKTVSNTKT